MEEEEEEEEEDDDGLSLSFCVCESKERSCWVGSNGCIVFGAYKFNGRILRSVGGKEVGFGKLINLFTLKRFQRSFSN